MPNELRRVLIAACLALSAICALLFYLRYWKWRECIDAAKSSCITPDGANLTSGGLIWGLLAAAFFAAAGRLFLRL